MGLQPVRKPELRLGDSPSRGPVCSPEVAQVAPSPFHLRHDRLGGFLPEPVV